MAEPDSSFPSSIYAENVLAINFRDAQSLFLDFLLEIHYAHTLMLAKQQIMPVATAGICLDALDRLDRDAIRSAPYDGKTEDLFFFVEKEIERLCGRDHAGWMHTARSRNDIDITLYRMYLRGAILQVTECMEGVQHALLTLAKQHLSTLMPAYTHTQPAQPITFAHYLTGAAELLERDAMRLQAAYRTVNRCPLGACAISTTGFPIDRHFTAQLLGFADLQYNSYGAIAATDYLTETAGAISTAMINLGRITQDFLLWCTSEFGYLRLSNAWVQISSIMPQKRNPVPFEHVRALASKAFSQAQGVLIGLHNTPWGDINDAEDDLQSLVAGSLTDAIRAFRIFAGVLPDCEVNVHRMRERAGADFLTVTELADTLVRREQMSFREAHGLVSAAVTALQGDARHSAIVDQLLHLLGSRARNTSGDDLLRALDPEEFVRIREIPGGPAAEAVKPAIDALEAEAKRRSIWLAAERKRSSVASARVAKERMEILQPAANCSTPES